MDRRGSLRTRTISSKILGNIRLEMDRNTEYKGSLGRGDWFTEKSDRGTCVYVRREGKDFIVFNLLQIGL